MGSESTPPRTVLLVRPAELSLQHPPRQGPPDPRLSQKPRPHFPSPCPQISDPYLRSV